MSKTTSRKKSGWFPSSGSDCYTQVQPNRKIRHFGMDAEIQAMDGNKSVVQMLESGNMSTRSFMFSVTGTSVVAPSSPSLDAGFRHPCRNDEVPTRVNDESGCLGTSKPGFHGRQGSEASPGAPCRGRLCNLDTGDPCRYDGCINNIALPGRVDG